MPNDNNNGISNTNSPNGKYMAPRPEGVKPNCVVITYSVSDNINSTLEALQARGASVHYITDKDGTQYQYHNDLTDQAFYAGKSSWKGEVGVNKFGIGNMLINDEKNDFSKEQIGKLKSFLADIATRYPDLDLKHDLVGLGEVTVNRGGNAHIAPGSKFPWKELAEAGFGRYFETTQDQKSKVLLSPDSTGEQVDTLQTKLKAYGYGVESTSTFDQITQQAVRVFNDRYDTGLPNEEPPVTWTEASEYELSKLLGEELVGDTI